MDPLHKKAIAQGIAGMAVFVVFVFLPAGTWHYWQRWLFIAVFSASTIGFTVYFAPYDRPLLERRMNAGPQHEKEGSQKIIVSLIKPRWPLTCARLPVPCWGLHDRTVLPLYFLGAESQ